MRREEAGFHAKGVVLVYESYVHLYSHPHEMSMMTICVCGASSILDAQSACIWSAPARSTVAKEPSRRCSATAVSRE